MLNLHIPTGDSTYVVNVYVRPVMTFSVNTVDAQDDQQSKLVVVGPSSITNPTGVAIGNNCVSIPTKFFW